MRQGRNILAPIMVLGIALVTGGWFLQKGMDRDESLYAQVRVFQEVMDHVSRGFVNQVEDSDLYDSAIEGVLESLGDPHTSLIDAETWESFRFRSGADAEYGGVGLEILRREGEITVMTPLPGGPSLRAGIRTGDVIAEVDGESTADWDSDVTADRLRGRPGTAVVIGIRRPGVETVIPFAINRAVIELLSVPFSVMLQDGIGYLPLQVFSQTSTKEVREALASLDDQGMTSLVLDLRGNPGGLLDEGAGVADLFLREGVSIVETKGRTPEQNQAFVSRAGQLYPDLPIVVLLDGGSASASEILAGALQDHDRALVVGVQSYGKGSVQTLYRLTGGDILRLTTAKWYTPSGRTIQKDYAAQNAASDPRNVAVGLMGEPVARPTPSDPDVPTFSSMGGRTLMGGGGITPDVVVMPDTLSTSVRDAVLALGARGGSISTAVFDFAVRFVQDREVEAGFSLPSAELDRFLGELGELGEGGEGVEASVLRDSRSFLQRRVEREIMNQTGGDEGRFLHEVAWDLPVREAIRLLARVDSQAGLFAEVDQTVGAEPVEVGSSR